MHVTEDEFYQLKVKFAKLLQIFLSKGQFRIRRDPDTDPQYGTEYEPILEHWPFCDNRQRFPHPPKLAGLVAGSILAINGTELSLHSLSAFL
jgi:hypothetical protein